jgi:hypothetical protein
MDRDRDKCGSFGSVGAWRRGTSILHHHTSERVEGVGSLVTARDTKVRLDERAE